MIGTDYKYSIRCSFCSGHGHNISTCKEVDIYYESFKTKVSLGRSPLLMERRAALEMTKRKSRQSQRKKPKASSRCSFCREEGHRRPRCVKLNKLRSDTYKANEIWRRRFVKMINDTGMGIGAYIKVPTQIFDWHAPRDHWTSCFITDYDLDTFNIFNAYSGRDNYTTTARMSISTIAKLENFVWNFSKSRAFTASGLIKPSFRNEDHTIVVSGSEWNPPEEWYTEECMEIEYVLKKVSEGNNSYTKIQELLNKWKES